MKLRFVVPISLLVLVALADCVAFDDREEADNTSDWYLLSDEPSSQTAAETGPSLTEDNVKLLGELQSRYTQLLNQIDVLLSNVYGLKGYDLLNEDEEGADKEEPPPEPATGHWEYRHKRRGLFRQGNKGYRVWVTN